MLRNFLDQSSPCQGAASGAFRVLGYVRAGRAQLFRRDFTDLTKDAGSQGTHLVSLDVE